MSAVVQVTGLRKEYRNLRGGKTVALDGIDFEIPGPGVYGLLGPNGSGKTTTIRCLLGLVRPTSGHVRMFGADQSELPSVIHKVGALVEGPKFSPNMSGRVNLELFAQMSGLSRSRVHEVLELVELTERANDPVGAYSLGMGQRLGIAAAMLGNPELVILDEPTNGLDPAGMADVRRLVRRLADEGRTVLVSSHQLHEIQQTCDRVIIFDAGKIITAGSVAEIIGSASGRRILVSVENRASALDILTRAGFSAMPSLGADQLVVQIEDGTGAADINRLLAHQGVFAYGIAADTVSLEDAFLSLTTKSSALSNPNNEAVAASSNTKAQS